MKDLKDGICSRRGVKCASQMNKRCLGSTPYKTSIKSAWARLIKGNEWVQTSH